MKSVGAVIFLAECRFSKNSQPVCGGKIIKRRVQFARPSVAGEKEGHVK